MPITAKLQERTQFDPAVVKSLVPLEKVEVPAAFAAAKASISATL
jgi:hypothetical protein